MSKELFETVHVLVTERLETLKSSTYADLLKLVEPSNQREEVIKISNAEIHFGVWAESHGDKLAVLSEARRIWLWGLYSQVTAEGFFISKDGKISPFLEKDYWEHGY